MRNLKLYSIAKNVVQESCDQILCCISNDTLFILSNLNILTVQEGTTRLMCNIKEHIQKDDNLPIYLGVSGISNNLVVCLDKGEILAINIDTLQVELVGSIETGILQAAWSPGTELFAVVTNKLTLILFSQDLEPLHEIELCQTGIEQQVSVGWGSEETQFRGSEGKLKAKDVSHEVTSKADDGRVRISWHGDGQCFVVSYYRDNFRHLKVCSSDGTLLHSCEAVPELEGPLAWRPNGSIIATSKKLPQKRMICFFEKNLLPHGGFQISDDTIVKDLFWNCDSSILAVYIKLPFPIIKLYTTSNYHWYDKYTITLEKDEKLVLAEWDSFDVQTLNIITSSGSTISHSRWSWRWNVDSSKADSKDDEATVAVIDGQRLLLTLFKKCVIPPPMSSCVVETSKPITGVEFLQHESENKIMTSNDFIVQCGENIIHFYKYDINKATYILTFTENFPEKNLVALSYITENCVLACSVDHNSHYELLKISVNLSSPSKTDVKSISLKNPVVAIRFSTEKNCAILWDTKQVISLMELSTLSVVEIINVSGSKSSKFLGIEVQSKIFVLDSTYRLSIDNAVIASNVTSFRVANDHLLVTTMQHKLLCWPLNNLDRTASERSVERGSKIITVVPGTSNVILQLPRGNLEVIRPRALTISRLKGYLNDLKFGLAMSIMRVERVNLNLFYDHNPSLFLSNISVFISDITDVSYLCNFIAELSTENVTQTMYSSFYEKCDSNIDGKVIAVCTALLKAFDSGDDKAKYFLPVLSCLIKKGNTDDALVLVQKKVQAEKRGEKESVTSSDGLAHIIYLVDLEQLFKIALGTYDLNLVMFIASKSQKDPKEYLPFLSHLQNMDENYQKFTIDNFLKRYSKALGYLSLCPDKTKECLEYVVKHNLYRHALRLFAPNTDSWKAVCVSYGAELTRTSRHDEAGVLLQKAEEYLLAQYAFSRAGAWRKEIECAKLGGMSNDQMKQLYISIANNLLTSGRYSEAAQFFLNYKKDIDAGVAALCESNSFHDAMGVVDLNNRKDLIGTCIKPSAIAACKKFEQTIFEAKESFERHLLRLKEVQRTREESGALDWDDTSSESSQGSSRSSSRASSRASTRSAKNARKLERNLIKKGGPFEEVALIAAIYDIITQMTKLKSPIRSLNLVLIALNEQANASNLQIILFNFLELIKSSIPQVWPKNKDGCEGTSNSIAASFNSTTRVLPAPVQALQPKFLFPPDLCNNVEWQLELLYDA